MYWIVFFLFSFSDRFKCSFFFCGAYLYINNRVYLKNVKLQTTYIVWEACGCELNWLICWFFFSYASDTFLPQHPCYLLMPITNTNLSSLFTFTLFNRSSLAFLNRSNKKYAILFLHHHHLAYSSQYRLKKNNRRNLLDMPKYLKK